MISLTAAAILRRGGFEVTAFKDLMSFILDWSSNHLLNPLWHPHARYHGAILLFFFGGTASVATWLIWRHTSEPQVALTAASLLSVAYWTPFFYVPFFLPESSYWAGISGHEPRVAGVMIYPNLIVVAIFLLLTLCGWWLGNSSTKSQLPGTKFD